MTRARALVLCALLATGTVCLAAPQQPQQASPALQAFSAKNAEFVKLYQGKDFAAALRALDEMVALGQQAQVDQSASVTIIYNKACVFGLMGQAEAAVAAARQAIAAGYANYAQFTADSDFEIIRRHPAWVAFLKDLRHKYGAKPIEWDRARTAEPVTVILDPPSHPSLVAMRKEFGIDAVVSEAGTDDYAKLKAVTAWVSRQWRHSPSEMASKGDPVTILREARAGGRFICRDYAIVVAGTAAAYGLPARVVNLLPRDVETRSEAHAVAEVWIARLGKWVLADGQYGIVAEADGMPLNAVELQAALSRDDDRVGCAVGAERCAEWKWFIAPNMFYFKTGQDQRRFEVVGGPQYVLVPKGASDPHKFAGGNESNFAGAVYISDPAVFYARPW